MLTLLNRRLSRARRRLIGAGSVGLAAVVAILVAASFIVSPPAGDAYPQVLWTWFDIGGLQPQIALYLDAMSVIFMLVITFVGFLIHLYSTEFMERDEGFTRFFMYMNLFVASMLVLVLADNLLLLYLGWEGVGLCSYLLIAFWQKDVQNVYCGRKAFIVTRIGDTALIVGLFLLFTQFHTLEIQPLMQRRRERRVRRRPGCRGRRGRCCSAAPSASRRSCRCRPGCPTPWPARPRSARSSTPPPWSPPACTSSRAPTSCSCSRRTCAWRWPSSAP